MPNIISSFHLLASRQFLKAYFFSMSDLLFHQSAMTNFTSVKAGLHCQIFCDEIQSGNLTSQNYKF